MVSPRGVNGITPGTGGFNVPTHNGVRVMKLKEPLRGLLVALTGFTVGPLNRKV